MFKYTKIKINSCCIMIGMIFLKVLMLIRQVHQKGFFHYWYFPDKGFMFEISCVRCHQCHDVLMMSIDLNSIGILSINGIDYRCIISRISKSGDIRLLKNVDLSEKSRTL